MPEAQGPPQLPESGPTATTPDAAREAMAETQRVSSKSMDDMINKVPSVGRFFAQIGFKDTSGFPNDQDRWGTEGKGYDGRVLLLIDEQEMEDGSTVFTAIAGAGPRQIRVESEERVNMIRQEIVGNVPQLKIGGQITQKSEEEMKIDIKNRGVPLKGLLNREGTEIQIGTSVFSTGNGSLIFNPSEQNVVDAMKRSIEKSKQADHDLIIKTTVEDARTKQATLRSLEKIIASA